MLESATFVRNETNQRNNTWTMKEGHYLFTSESVSEGHPDKVADQISDALLDEFLAQDQKSKVACETLVTTGLVVVAGEVKSNAYVDVQEVVRETVNGIGYNKGEYLFDGNSCGVMTAIHEQSPDITMGIVKVSDKEQGAGDQGMMFGYAVNENDDYMPTPLYLAHKILMELSAIRKEGKAMLYLRPDAKAQVTVEYDENNKPYKIDTIVVSTQHDNFLEDEVLMRNAIERDVMTILVPRVMEELPMDIAELFKRGDAEGGIKYFVNPTGKFVIGGPAGDTGLTGRKIIVDTYGGKGAHGGGAFSGKDASKVDRSAAYAARHIAKNLVAAGVANEVLVQVAYAIGVAEPVSVYVNTFGTANVNATDNEIADKVSAMFGLTPYEIKNRLKLEQPMYLETAAYGHFGRKPSTVTKHFVGNGMPFEMNVELFTWEKLDYVERIRTAFNIA